MRKVITESQLRRIVNESVKRVLKEITENELDDETLGFLDFFGKTDAKQGGSGNRRIINGKVYSFSLKIWKEGYDKIKDEKGRLPTYREYINWLDENCLIPNESAEESMSQYSKYQSEKNAQPRTTVKKTTYEVEGSTEPCYEVTDGYTLVRIAPYYHYIGNNTLFITQYLDGEYQSSEEWNGDFNSLSPRDALKIAKEYSAYLK